MNVDIAALRAIERDKEIPFETVLEAIEARALGLEIVGLSCLTNYAAGLRAQPLRHEDVLRASEGAAAALAALLSAAGLAVD